VWSSFVPKKLGTKNLYIPCVPIGLVGMSFLHLLMHHVSNTNNQSRGILHQSNLARGWASKPITIVVKVELE
jgi:hypothetical protein